MIVSITQLNPRCDLMDAPFPVSVSGPVPENSHLPYPQYPGCRLGCFSIGDTYYCYLLLPWMLLKRCVGHDPVATSGFSVR